MCGPSGGEQAAANAMKQTSQEQNQAYQQARSQAQSIFGSSSQVFNQLTSAFSPILAAGPGQSGYTAGELQNLNSQAVTSTGQAYRNAAQAAEERGAAAGGGNTLLPSGATAAVQGNIAAQGASQTANELSQIQTNNANIGRQNWLSAAGVLSGAPNVFSPATSALGTSTGVGQAAQSGNQQVFGNQQELAKENNWWQPLVGQALGGVLDVATGGLSGLATSTLGSFKGNSSPTPGSQSWMLGPGTPGVQG